MTGTDFKAIRTKLGITTAEVAEQAGVKPQSIMQFESNKRPGRRVGVAERNVQALQAAYEARQSRMARIDELLAQIGN